LYCFVNSASRTDITSNGRNDDDDDDREKKKKNDTAASSQPTNKTALQHRTRKQRTAAHTRRNE